MTSLNHGKISWSEMDLGHIETAERLGSSLSLCGSLFIISTFLSSTSFRKPARRLIFYATLGNIMSNIATFFARQGIREGPTSALCQFQAFFIQLWMPADALWAFCMVLNVYLSLCKRYSVEQLQHLEWKYFMACYGLPLPISLVLWFATTPEGGHFYGPALIWCSIAQEWNQVRVACFYAPAGALIFLISIIYTIIAIRVMRDRKFLIDISRKQQNAMGLDCYRRNKGFAAQLQITPKIGKLKKRNDVSGTTSRYLMVSLLFFLSLVMTWLPSMADRVYSILHPDAPVFWLNLIAAFVLTLQGFWNAMIYVCTSWCLCREFVLQKLGYLRPDEQLPCSPDLPSSSIETDREMV